jgi:3-oxoacyl-[acyl-carrier protein] reductase
MKLTGKIAVVTGASKGIGAAIARELATAGATVVVNYSSSPAAADAVVADIVKRGGRALAVQGNVTDPSDIARLFTETKASFGRVDILVNNAGSYEFIPLGAISAEHFHRLFDLNVLGLILTTQEALKLFGADGGAIVNVSSIVSTSSAAGGAVYSATKAAVDSLTRTFAKELAAKKIRVNSVNPGLIDTESMQASAIAGHQGAVAAMTPLGRLGLPADIAPVVRFLASPDSGWITGESLYATGGLR